MRTLIPDICHIIFAMALQSACTHQCCSDIALSPTPACSLLTLAHVCSRWRAIVFDSPRLWYNLHIRLICPQPSFISFWFQNARAVPVRVTVCPGIASPSCRATLDPLRNVNWSLVKELVPYLNHISSLVLHVHQSALPMLFPRGSVSDMVQLHTSSSNIGDTSSTMTTSEQSTRLGYAPWSCQIQVPSATCSRVHGQVFVPSAYTRSSSGNTLARSPSLSQVALYWKMLQCAFHGIST